jgi:hypothetical protein
MPKKLNPHRQRRDAGEEKFREIAPTFGVPHSTISRLGA